MKKNVTALLFLLWVFGLAAAMLLLPDRDFSEMENRYLQTLPAPSSATLWSGRFGTDFEKYLNDQFPARDACVRLNTAMQYAIGLRERNEVYYTKDRALIQKANAPARISSNAKAVRAFAENHDIPVYMALIPSALSIRAEALPQGAPGQAQQTLMQEAYAEAGVQSANVYAALSAQKDAYIYYNTDHHWTSLGAYYGYTAIAEAMGLQPAAPGMQETLSEDFYGTLYSKAPAFWLPPDSIDAYVADEGVTVRAYNGDTVTVNTLYCRENLLKKDKYTVFLGGNQPRVIVETQQKDAPRLLILRDSYADSLVPYLTRHFSEIHLLDCRYYKLPAADYIKENHIDAVLLCYSLYNFSADANLPLVLGR